jgi:ABC-type cobalamin/Fe3+-siderophores transport system ATPase subunit
VQPQGAGKSALLHSVVQQLHVEQAAVCTDSVSTSRAVMMAQTAAALDSAKDVWKADLMAQRGDPEWPVTRFVNLSF